MASMHDDAGYSSAPGIAEQMGYVPARHAQAGPAMVIDLSNSPSPGTSAGEPPPRRARRGQRRGAGSRTLPILQARRSGRVLEAWCPPCRCYHTHSVHGADADCGPGCGCVMHRGGHGPCTCPPGSGDGHRTAHCGPGSPFKDRGYYLEEVGR